MYLDKTKTFRTHLGFQFTSKMNKYRYLVTFKQKTNKLKNNMSVYESDTEIISQSMSQKKK